MTHQNAIVLGGTEDHIGLIAKLKDLNYYVILVDYNINPPAKKYADVYIQESTLNQEKVLEIAKQLDISLIIAACIDQALLTIAYVSEKLKLPCHISYKTALDLTNKAYMKTVFKNNKIPTASFVIKELNQKVEVNLNYPLV